jgi:hypothetical protein
MCELATIRPSDQSTLSLHTVYDRGGTLNLQTIKAKNEKDRLSKKSLS